MEWKTQMPWISYDNEKGIARCTICTKAKFSHDSESASWAHGLACLTKDGWKKWTFTHHERTKAHVAAKQVRYKYYYMELHCESLNFC